MFANFFKRIKSHKKIIFIVEDNEVYAKYLQAFLHSRFPEVKEIKVFQIGELCLRELDREPSIVILDYFLNSKYHDAQNGLEIINRIKLSKPKTNIIVLSVQQNLEVILEIVKKHNCVYVQKDIEAFNKVKLAVQEIFYLKNPPPFTLWN